MYNVVNGKDKPKDDQTPQKIHNGMITQWHSLGSDDRTILPITTKGPKRRGTRMKIFSATKLSTSFPVKVKMNEF